jgi:protein-disulfide isomerase
MVLLNLTINICAQSGDIYAKIGEQTITSLDISAEARQGWDKLGQTIAEVRKDELQQEINQLLFETEAAVRKLKVINLLSLELGKLVKKPTEAQIKAVYDQNRDQLGGATLPQVRQQIINYLIRTQEDKLMADYAKQLQIKHKVVFGVDINSPNLKPTDVLATVGTRKITAEKIIERLKPIEYQIRLEAFEPLNQSLQQIVYFKTVTLEAQSRRQNPEDIIRQEVTDKLVAPTEAEVKDFYEKNKARLKVDFAQVRSEIEGYLAEKQRQELEQKFRQQLFAKYNVQFLLTEPPLPVQKISVDDDPSQGSVNAPVTIVMFTDFQCPACAATHPIVKEVLKNYAADKVRFVVRDFPLVNLHPDAIRAAEAANAANEQGKFFEFIELLYANQKSLNLVSLKKFAAQAGLNAVKFIAAMVSGKFKAEIQKDVADGTMYGINSTPTIFVNGVKLRELSTPALREAIERNLNPATK